MWFEEKGDRSKGQAYWDTLQAVEKKLVSSRFS